MIRNEELDEQLKFSFGKYIRLYNSLKNQKEKND